MKKTDKAKKLQLEKVTVRKLVTSELVDVGGGGQPLIMESNSTKVCQQMTGQ